MIIEMRVYGTREALLKAWQEDTKQEQNWLTYCYRDKRVATKNGDTLYRLADSFETAFSTLQGLLWVDMYIDNSVPSCPKLLSYLRSRMRPVEHLKHWK